MSDAVLTFGFVLGMDSFLVACALGLFLSHRLHRWMLAGAFGVCDGLAVQLGYWLSPMNAASFAWCEWLGIALVDGYGCFVLLMAYWGRSLAEQSNSRRARWLPFLLPVALSLDNLVFGIESGGTESMPLETALFFGIVSSALAAAGLAIGASLARAVPARSNWLAGSALVLVASVLCCRDLAS